MQTFFKMGNFKRPSLTYGTTQGHQIFTFAKQMRLLVDYQVLSRSHYNRGRYNELHFEKSKKIRQSLGAPNLS